MELDTLYLFTGSEEPVIRTRINRLIDELSKIPSTVIKYDIDLTSLKKIIADAVTIPFLEEQKIFVLKNPKFLTTATVTNEIKGFNSYLLNPNPTSIIIIDATNTNINPESLIYKTLLKKASVIDIKRLEDIELGGIIIRKLSLNGVSIRDDALKLLLEHLNHNLIRTENEIEKLSLYAGPGGVITTDDIMLLVNKDLDDDIFNLAKAIVTKDRSKIIRIYNELSLNTNDTLGILGMISKAFIELLITSKLLLAGYNNQDIATLCNISKGRAYYLIKDAKNFKIEELNRYIENLAELDYKIKTGQISKNVGFELLLLKI